MSLFVFASIAMHSQSYGKRYCFCCELTFFSPTRKTIFSMETEDVDLAKKEALVRFIKERNEKKDKKSGAKKSGAKKLNTFQNPKLNTSQSLESQKDSMEFKKRQDELREKNKENDGMYNSLTYSDENALTHVRCTSIKNFTRCGSENLNNSNLNDSTISKLNDLSYISNKKNFYSNTKNPKSISSNDFLSGVDSQINFLSDIRHENKKNIEIGENFLEDMSIFHGKKDGFFENNSEDTTIEETISNNDNDVESFHGGNVLEKNISENAVMDFKSTKENEDAPSHKEENQPSREERVKLKRLKKMEQMNQEDKEKKQKLSFRLVSGNTNSNTDSNIIGESSLYSSFTNPFDDLAFDKICSFLSSFYNNFRTYLTIDQIRSFSKDNQKKIFELLKETKIEDFIKILDNFRSLEKPDISKLSQKNEITSSEKDSLELYKTKEIETAQIMSILFHLPERYVAFEQFEGPYQRLLDSYTLNPQKYLLVEFPINLEIKNKEEIYEKTFYNKEELYNFFTFPSEEIKNEINAALI